MRDRTEGVTRQRLSTTLIPYNHLHCFVFEHLQSSSQCSLIRGLKTFQLHALKTHIKRDKFIAVSISSIESSHDGRPSSLIRHPVNSKYKRYTHTPHKAKDSYTCHFVCRPVPVTQNITTIWERELGMKNENRISVFHFDQL